jgi:two-component system sensor histidine kinase HydH
VRVQWRHAGVLAGLTLPALLVAASIRSYRAIGDMREVFLRHRAAMMAYQLEIAPSGPDAIEELKAHEPDLDGIAIFPAPLASGPEAARVNAVFDGVILYDAVEAGPLYRVYLPVHRPNLSVARVDISTSAADFLVRDGRRNLLLAVAAASGSLLLLGAYLVAARRRLERERLAELGEMSAVLAHEIRNPLGTIKGYAQLARERSTGLAAELLDPVVRETERLENLVRNLLLFARPARIEPAAVRWSELVPRLEPVGAPVRLHMQAPLDLTFKADPHALLQILTNLIRNAVEATGGDGEIQVRARREGRHIVIEVEDDGPGLSPAAREHLFQPFFTTKTSGTGLGLAVSRRLAAQLGGKLELETAEPHGVRAVLTLPAAG